MYYPKLNSNNKCGVKIKKIFFRLLQSKTLGASNNINEIVLSLVVT